MKTKEIKIELPPDSSFIFGQSHFIKTVEDIYELMVGTSTVVEFGIAFCEASGPCLIRSDGNNVVLIKAAESTAYDIACGHTFVIFMQNAYPINFLPRLKMVPEIVNDLLRDLQSGGGDHRGNRAGARRAGSRRWIYA